MKTTNKSFPFQNPRLDKSCVNAVHPGVKNRVKIYDQHNEGERYERKCALKWLQKAGLGIFLIECIAGFCSFSSACPTREFGNYFERNGTRITGFGEVGFSRVQTGESSFVNVLFQSFPVWFAQHISRFKNNMPYRMNLHTWNSTVWQWRALIILNGGQILFPQTKQYNTVNVKNQTGNQMLRRITFPARSLSQWVLFYGFWGTGWRWEVILRWNVCLVWTECFAIINKEEKGPWRLNVNR